MCPYAVVSLQKSIGGSTHRSPSPKREHPKGCSGVAVNGGLATGCTIVRERRVR